MHWRQYLDLLVYVAALVPTVAWARDIECAATRPSVGRVVCDLAISSNECDDIVAQLRAPPDDGEPVAYCLGTIHMFATSMRFIRLDSLSRRESSGSSKRRRHIWGVSGRLRQERETH